MDYKLVDNLNKASQDMLYGLDLLYIIQCALDYCKGLELGSKAASSLYIAWEWLNNSSTDISHCVDVLNSSLGQEIELDG